MPSRKKVWKEKDRKKKEKEYLMIWMPDQARHDEFKAEVLPVWGWSWGGWISAFTGMTGGGGWLYGNDTRQRRR